MISDAAVKYNSGNRTHLDLQEDTPSLTEFKPFLTSDNKFLTISISSDLTSELSWLSFLGELDPDPDASESLITTEEVGSESSLNGEMCTQLKRKTFFCSFILGFFFRTRKS